MTALTSIAEERFWARVDKTDACWFWVGRKGNGGYGRFTSTDKRTYAAHRFSYELLVGPIPEGLELDHLCVTPSCVNPAHLEPVTAEENHRRMIERRTHCPNGHRYTPETTTYRNYPGKKNPVRRCLVCQRAVYDKRNARRRKGGGGSKLSQSEPKRGER